MGKTIKRLLTIALFMFLVGIVLCGISFALGVRSSNITFFGYNSGKTINVDTTFTESIQSLDVDISAGTLRIEKGDEFRVVAENVPEKEFSAKVENGVLKVEDETKLFLNFIPLGLIFDDEEQMKVTIYVPDDYELEKLEVDISAGKGFLNDLTAKKADIEVEAGSIEVSNLLVSDKTELNVGAGSIVLSAATLHDMSVDVSAGEADIQGAVTGKNELSCGAGTINVDTSLRETEYDYKSDCNAGSVKVNGEKLTDDEKINNDASNSFDMDCNAGSILITTIS